MKIIKLIYKNKTNQKNLNLFFLTDYTKIKK